MTSRSARTGEYGHHATRGIATTAIGAWATLKQAIFTDGTALVFSWRCGRVKKGALVSLFMISSDGEAQEHAGTRWHDAIGRGGIAPDRSRVSWAMGRNPGR